MSDIECFEKGSEGSLPHGLGVALAILGGLGSLPLVLAAAMTGLSLWIVFALWVVGGPALTVVLAVFAVSLRSGGEGSVRNTLMEAHNNA